MPTALPPTPTTVLTVFEVAAAQTPQTAENDSSATSPEEDPVQAPDLRHAMHGIEVAQFS